MNKQIFENFMPGICDKCGKKVPKKNSCLLVLEYAEGKTPFAQDRHLYPSKDCEGSPSRVKLIQTKENWKKAYNFIKQCGSCA